jgi:hypothetical protein
MEAQKSPEMGRELLADDLVVKTVVVIGRDPSDYAVTVWVGEVAEKYVAFRAGDINTTFLAVRHPDGTLTDDTDSRIHVWEYLGEV